VPPPTSLIRVVNSESSFNPALSVSIHFRYMSGLVFIVQVTWITKYHSYQAKALGFLYAFEESADCVLLPSFFVVGILSNKLRSLVHYSGSSVRARVAPPRAYARVFLGVNGPSWAWYFTKSLLPAQRKLIVASATPAAPLCSTARIRRGISAAWFCSCKLLWLSDECVLLPFFNTQPKFCSYELLCRSIEFNFLRYPTLERW